MSRARAGEFGFSLLEVLIAVVVLGTTMAVLGGLFAIAAASTRMARSETLAMLLATDKIEQLRALAWTFDATGRPVSDTTSDVSVQPETNSGQGLRASPPDSLHRAASGYVDYVDEVGRWVGNGPQPPGVAVFVRRWNIRPLPADPANTLVFQVLVTPVAASSTVALGPAPRRPGDALLTSLKTRKGL